MDEVTSLIQNAWTLAGARRSDIAFASSKGNVICRVQSIVGVGVGVILMSLAWISRLSFASPSPTPTPWPHQFHSRLWVNTSGSLSQIDLWYDWPNGRNFNIIRDQLAAADDTTYDLEWNNGTSFVYTPVGACRTVAVGVGILRPDWLVDDSTYLGQRQVDGFLCNVWTKADFIWNYEDVVTKRPVF